MVFHKDCVIIVFSGFLYKSANLEYYIEKTDNKKNNIEKNTEISENIENNTENITGEINYATSEIKNVNNLDKIRKINFIKELKKIANVHIVEYSFINIINTYSSDFHNDVKTYKLKFNRKKYRNDKFNIEDLDYKNICQNIHKQVIDIYGKNKKIICIGIEFGANISMVYANMYNKDCILCISVNSMPYTSKILSNQNYISKYIKNNKDLHKLLNKLDNLQSLIDNNINIEENEKKKEENVIILRNLVFTYGVNNNIKYYTDNMLTKTIFIRSGFISNMSDKSFIFNINDKYMDDESIFLYNVKNMVYIFRWNIGPDGRIWLKEQKLIPSIINSNFSEINNKKKSK